MRLSAGVLLLSTALGCQAITDRLGQAGDETPQPDAAPAVEADASQPASSENPPADDVGEKKRRHKKKGRRKGKRAAGTEDVPAPAPLPPALELDAALARAVIVGDGETPTRLDPFVLTLVAETLERDHGAPFSRTTKAQRKAGVPAGLKVGALKPDSLWARVGFREGDYVLAVGSARPPGPKRSRALLETLSLAPSFAVELQRGDAQQTLRFEVVPGLAWQTYLEQQAGRSFPAAAPARADAPRVPNSSGGSRSTKPKPKPAPSSKPSSALRVSCSGSTCTIPKSDFDRLVGSSSRVKKEARGKSTSAGYKLTFVGPAARKAGFRVGDVVRKVNGKSTNNTLHMLSLYSGIKSTRTFRVESTRGGTKRTTTIRVKG